MLSAFASFFLTKTKDKAKVIFFKTILLVMPTPVTKPSLKTWLFNHNSDYHTLRTPTPVVETPNSEKYATTLNALTPVVETGLNPVYSLIMGFFNLFSEVIGYRWNPLDLVVTADKLLKPCYVDERTLLDLEQKPFSVRLYN